MVDRVLVTELSQDVFFARIVIQMPNRTVEVDSRPSDAIAVAVRTGAPIMVDEKVMEKAGVSLDGDDEDERSVRVSLTEEGRRLREKGLGFGERTFKASGLSAEEFSVLQKAVARLRDNLVKASKEDT